MWVKNCHKPPLLIVNPGEEKHLCLSVVEIQALVTKLMTGGGTWGYGLLGMVVWSTVGLDGVWGLFQLNWFCEICCSSLVWQLIDAHMAICLVDYHLLSLFKFRMWSSIVFNPRASWMTSFLPQGQSFIIIKCFYPNCDMKRTPKTARILNSRIWLLIYYNS